METKNHTLAQIAELKTLARAAISALGDKPSGVEIQMAMGETLGKFLEKSGLEAKIDLTTGRGGWNREPSIIEDCILRSPYKPDPLQAITDSEILDDLVDPELPELLPALLSRVAQNPNTREETLENILNGKFSGATDNGMFPGEAVAARDNLSLKLGIAIMERGRSKEIGLMRDSRTEQFDPGALACLATRREKPKSKEEWQQKYEAEVGTSLGQELVAARTNPGEAARFLARLSPEKLRLLENHGDQDAQQTLAELRPSKLRLRILHGLPWAYTVRGTLTGPLTKTKDEAGRETYSGELAIKDGKATLKIPVSANTRVGREALESLGDGGNLYGKFSGKANERAFTALGKTMENPDRKMAMA